MARSKNKTFCESDLYKPVHDYLVTQGYTVRSEVANCDVTAVKDDELIVIELKRCLNLTLVAQGVDRQNLADSVYLAVPRPSNITKWKRQQKPVMAVLRRLELGLILVASSRAKTPVEVVFHPLPSEKRKKSRVRRAVLKEIEQRSIDLNQGGSCRRKLVTAYRENAIQIACYLAENGQMSPKQLREMGTGEKTLSILYNNVYAWFERVDRGVYALSAKGRSEIEQYPELLERYKQLLIHLPEK